MPYLGETTASSLIQVNTMDYSEIIRSVNITAVQEPVLRGRFGWTRDMMGLKNMLTTVYRDPGLPA